MPLVPVIDCTTGRTRRHVDRNLANTMKGVRLVRDGKGRVIRVLEGDESPMVQELARLKRPSNYGLQYVDHIRLGGGEFDEQRPVPLRWLHGVPS